MLLSPLAPAFSPSLRPDQCDIAIYNDGVPCMRPADQHSESCILQGIQEEALDEFFSPTAQEAAEIEAAEIFVGMMARLALLEEREEHARQVDLSTMLPKRWEARREQGLVGKPRPARERPQNDDSTTKAHDKTVVHETRLVSHEHRHKDLQLTEYVWRERTRAEFDRIPTKVPKTKRPHHYRMPIQQPNKFV